MIAMKHIFDFDFSMLENLSTVKSHKKQQITYFNVPMAFDIETTSLYVHEETGETISCKGHTEARKGKSKTSYDPWMKMAFPYIWMVGIGEDVEQVYFGRSWESLKWFISKLHDYLDLSDKKRLICYVHNLPYEFQFMHRDFDFYQVFAPKKNMPLYAVIREGIEFRDSYKLSGLSLADTAKNLVWNEHKDFEKKTGDLDYSKIRHCETPLTREEIGYCEMDITVLLAYIKEQIAMYDGDVTKVPLTNTGRVRTKTKEACFHTHDKEKGAQSRQVAYRGLMKKLRIGSLNEYYMMKNAMQGGFTHANLLHVGGVFHDVHSIDFTSSYPAVMLVNDFPMSAGKHIPCDGLTRKDLDDYEKHYLYIAKITFVNLLQKFRNESYISEYKCNRSSKIRFKNNGRVISGERVTTTITNIDLQIIDSVYDYDDMIIEDLYIYKERRLPAEIRKTILDLYQDKTTLKGVVGEEANYMLSKGMLNSMYGMCVTDTIMSNVSYDGQWHDDPLSWAMQEDNLKEYNTNHGRFLFYAWGVFVTAYARRNLWRGILNIGDDYLYSDTDSIKFLNYDKHTKFINWYNESIESACKQACVELGLPSDYYKPKTKDGIEKPIGVWDYDDHYTNFKTLGAKRYIYDSDYGKKAGFHITIAGLSKSEGKSWFEKYKDKYTAFHDRMFVPANETGKNTHTYIDETMIGTVTDYLGNTRDVETSSGVHLEAAPFTMDSELIFEQHIQFCINGELYDGMMEMGYDLE